MEFIQNVIVVLRDIKYAFLFILLAGIMLFIFGISMQIIFTSPKFIIVPSFIGAVDMMFFFIVPIFSSMAITMMVYRLLKLRAPLKSENKLGFFASVISPFVSACACAGFLIPLASILASIGLSTVFITAHLNEIRIFITTLIIGSFYYTAKNLTVGCKLKLK